jgi:phage-related protein
MDVGPIQVWKEGSYYKKNDIVRLENLSYPDSSQEIRYENGVGSIHSSSSSSVTPIGQIFDVESSIEYVASCMIRKEDSSSTLNDENRTVIAKQWAAGGNGPIKPSTSIGIGIGIEFYNQGGGLIPPDDLRFTHRLVASSELDEHEWMNTQIHIREESVPDGARKARLVLLCLGHSSGTFQFTNLETRPANRFFYCMEDHDSSVSPMVSYNDKWTQEFFWRPAYGGSTQFSAINENLKIGEGADYVNNLAINSLPMSISVQFDNKTDHEARAIIHFMQEKFFAYESIFSLDYKGERLLSSEVQSFKFNYTYPYKKDLRYTCTSFNHSIPYRNKHTISATFICNTGSTLQSVESHSGYNKYLDGILPVAISGTVKFEKDVPITLRTYSIEATEAVDLEAEITRTREDEIEQENRNTASIDLTSIVDRISKYPDDEDAAWMGGIVTFTIPYDIEIGSCIFIRVDEPQNSIFNVGLTVIEGRLAENKYYYKKLVPGDEVEISPPLRPIADQFRNPLESNTVDDDLISLEADVTPEEYGYSLVKLSRCPWNCLSTSPLIPEGVDSIPSQAVNPDGSTSKRILFLPNYRRVQLESDIVPGMEEVTLTPLESFEMSESFDLIIPAIHGRSSIYIDKPNEIQKYPYLRLRNLEQRPSQTFSIDHSPDHIQSEFTKVYNKKFKRGINQNLSTFNITFNQRSDKEAKDILQFLESHLGYKKFRFQMPRPYLSDTEYHTSLSGKSSCVFYCPSWTHVVKYKNNHTINATFIESNTFQTEDLTKVFGLGEGRTPEAPCYEAEIFNFITKYEMCTFSSILEAAITYANGKDYMDDDHIIQTVGKQVDMVFVIDTGNEMFSSLKYISDAGVEESQPKIEIVLDVLKKMATSYGLYVAPGTDDFGQPSEINAPAISENSPPWPIDNATNSSLAQETFNDFRLNYPALNSHPYQFSGSYDSSQTRRFKVKIGLKEVNIGIVLVDQEKPVITLVGGAKSEKIGEETRTYIKETSRLEDVSVEVDEKVFIKIADEPSPSFKDKRMTFNLQLISDSNAKLAEVQVDEKTAGSSFESIIHKAVRNLITKYNSTGEENKSWMTFAIGPYFQSLVYYTWEGDKGTWTNQETGEASQVKKLVRKVVGKDPGSGEFASWIFLYNQKGEMQRLTKRYYEVAWDDFAEVKKAETKFIAWVDTEDPNRGYTGHRVGDRIPADNYKDSVHTNKKLTPSQKEELATEARAYCLHYAKQDGVFPPPVEIIDEEEVTETVDIFSDTSDNDYFDKVIIYNKLEALTPEKKSEINYLNAAREALYQLFFSTRSQTVTDRFIFMIGRGNPGKSAINLLNEVREGRDLSSRRPNDYDLFREGVISLDKLPPRYNAREPMPWHEDPLQTRVIFAGTMGVTEGPSDSGKKYAYDYYKNSSNPHGHLEVASDRLGRMSELGAFMDIFKTIEILCTDTGYQNLFKVTIHNCGPHDVKLLNTLVSSHGEDDPIKYTTELLASGIPKGGFSDDIQTIQAGGDMTVSVGIDDDSLLVDDSDNIISVESEEGDPLAMIHGAMDRSFILGEGGQFFGDPNNTNLLDSRNNRQNVQWESFNTKYEAHRANVPTSVDGGWVNHKQESRGVYNDGVAFKNMPVRVFRLESGLEIIDYNIGNISNENQKRGTYEHIPKLKPGEDIDLFFGIRSTTYDINDRATGGLEDVQLVFNAEDHTMNKMDSYANVKLRVFGQKIKFDFSKKQIPMFFPYGMETPEAVEEEEEELEVINSPVEGSWEFSGATLYSKMKMMVDFGPAIMEIQENGEPMSSEELIIGTAQFRSNVDLSKFDNKKLWNTLADNEDILEGVDVVASLPAGKAALYSGYSPPVINPVLGDDMNTVWDASYALRGNELFIFSEGEGKGPSAKSRSGKYIKKILSYEGIAVSYDAIDGTKVLVEDPRSSTFQYMFTFDDTSDNKSETGSGNDWQKAMKAAGHGEFYIAEGTWANPRLEGGEPTKPILTDIEATLGWIGSAASSKKATITRL